MMNRRLRASLAQISAEPDRRCLRRSLLPPLLLALSLFGPPGMTSAHEFRADERQRMVDEIVHIARSAGEVGRPALDDRVIAAMAKVPRHEFVPPEHRHAAYRNRPLPIGEGQTISQPYIVALMTDLLRLEGGEKVLEIGTGCGYQAAVLSLLVKNVFSVEIIETLAAEAAQRLQTEAEDLLSQASRSRFSMYHGTAVVAAFGAAAAIDAGDLERARHQVDIAYTAGRASKDMPIVAIVVVAEAMLALAYGEAATASFRLGLAARIRGADDPTDLMVARITAGAREVLGADGFQEQWSAGWAASRTEAIDLADPGRDQVRRR